MVHDILFAIWFMLPPGLANVAPIISARLPFVRRWQAPIDGGRTFRGQALLGDHKTWRGLVSGMIVATLALWIQQALVARFGWAQNLTHDVVYAHLPTWLLGPLFGLGALGGDAVESFFKRLRGKRSGESWIPFDQTDYILGAMIVSLLFVHLKWQLYVWMFLVYFLLHVFASYIGWLLKLKERPI